MSFPGYHPILKLVDSYSQKTSIPSYIENENRGLLGSSAESEGKVFRRNLLDDNHTFHEIPRDLELDDNLAEILGKCLEKEPGKRSTARSVHDEMCSYFTGTPDDKHVLRDWFNEMNIRDTINQERLKEYEESHR